jgi:septal ring-binding cell division protein DamX
MVNASSFLVGYFWGKKVSAQQACYAINRESFADKIYSAVCLHQGSPEDEQDSEEGEEENNQVATPVAEQEVDDAADDQSEQLASSQGSEMVEEAPVQYYAQLVGFHGKQQAEQFVEKLRKKTIPVILKERISRTAKGRKVIWYQVVTGPYETREKITAVVAQLKKEEKIRDVRIVQS